MRKAAFRGTVGMQSEPFRMRFTQSEPFRMRFAYFSRSIQRIQYITREIGGQIAVSLGTCHCFYILTLKDKVVKRSHLTIIKVSGGWDDSVLPLYSSSSWQKSFHNHKFSKLAVRIFEGLHLQCETQNGFGTGFKTKYDFNVKNSSLF